MDARELPARPTLQSCEQLANDLFTAHSSGDPDALRRIEDHFQLARVPTVEQLRAHTQQRFRRLRGPGHDITTLTLADAQFLVAASFGFESWAHLAGHIEAMNRKDSSVSQFERAVDAVVAGDLATLASLRRENPELIRARSTRVHHSSLLHYVSANGVEDFRQKTPQNAVDVVKLLLTAGAEVDAENNPGRGTTLGLVATSVHPTRAGVQIALMETLLDAGAAVDGLPGGWDPLGAALRNGRGEAAAFLAARGARMDLEGAAGVGRLDLVKSFFEEDGRLKASATAQQMKDGFLWACQYGRTSVVEFLLQKGVPVDGDVKRNRPTALHWAAYGGHVEIVKWMLERHMPVNVKENNFGGTPLGWALYGWGEASPEATRGNHYDVVARLVAAGATVDVDWLAEPDRGMPLVENVRADPRMRAALGSTFFS